MRDPVLRIIEYQKRRIRSICKKKGLKKTMMINPKRSPRAMEMSEA